MIQEIIYKGYSEQPADIECQDGELALSLGLIQEDEALQPIQDPEVLHNTTAANFELIYIHKLPNTDKALHIFRDISQSGLVIYYTDYDATTPSKTGLTGVPSDSTIYQVTSVGNTLIFLTSNGMYYFLWKGSQYTFLGNHIPEISLSFGLQAEMIQDDEFEILFPHGTNVGSYVNKATIKDEDEVREVTNAVLAKANKFIAEHSVGDGKFIFPFFVRYAYRLFDGSLTMHSAPILMVASSDVTPTAFVTEGDISSTSCASAKLRIAAPCHSLDFTSMTNLTVLNDWKDIVKSVDIFISKPIYTYDQNGQVETFVKGFSDCYAICKHVNQTASATDYPIQYQKAKMDWLYAKTFNAATLTISEWRLMLPRRDDDAIKADITDNAQFYLLASVSIGNLNYRTRTILPIGKEYLQSLVNREVMTDDYDSHDTLIPDIAFQYNARINVAGISKTLFRGFNPAAMFPYTDGYVAKYSDGEPPTAKNTPQDWDVTICIRQDNKEIVVKSETATFGQETPFIFIFYPNVNAYKAILHVSLSYGPGNYYQVPLTPHPTLNGAYAIAGWQGFNVTASAIPSTSVPSETADRNIRLYNKIYTSEISNPFLFPLLGINTVGSGHILGLSTAAKALSQGQFGQFPLYAFTSEGVWALEVSATGTYTARQPITRDVCINPDSITQIDSAVLFATDRGIMLLSGSDSKCISDSINTETPNIPFIASTLPHIDDVCPDAATTMSNIHPFLDFVEEAQMIYDYTHQRIILFNPEVPYAYVYSLKSKAWGMMASRIRAAIPSYPNAIAQLHDGTIVDYSQTTPGDSTTTAPGDSVDGSPSPTAPGDSVDGATRVIITRPIKLNPPHALKTIDTIIQRGQFRKGHIRTILYGSRDLYHWHLVYSSTDHYLRGFRGTPYKFFLIALLCNLQADESVYGCTVQYTPRLTNQPR